MGDNARYAFLVAGVLLAALLVVTAWVSWHDARIADDLAERGVDVDAEVVDSRIAEVSTRSSSAIGSS